ncbi:MAG: hypothetical protein IJI37_03950 [Opitutales bacterium]|nr:hypothetical protein [Opitutales bacterium]
MTLAIDIGSNTIKCLLGRARGGIVEKLYEKSLDCRILQSGGILVPDAADMISEAVALFEREASEFCPNFETELVATSALRGSVSREAVVAEVVRKTSRKIRVLSGEEEADLSFRGAMSDPLVKASFPCAYFDLGGGSLEIVAGGAGGVEFSASIPVGAVRLTRGCASADEYFSVSKKAFESALKDFPKTRTLIGAGGAVVAARFMKKMFFDAGAENEIPLDILKKCYAVVSSMSAAERVEKLRISAGRADIIPAAFACIISLMEFLGKETLVHTFHNLRYGIILSKEK